ncbi:hypothetical protein Vi05172_g8965 [Venturia inaequalis]|nr:hypothetical protein Vi05172_g8965 [Venturia inaequalis]
MKFTAILALFACATTITAARLPPGECPHGCPRNHVTGNCIPCDY